MNADLKKEWKEYLEQTQNHERIVRRAIRTFRHRSRGGHSWTEGRSANRRIVGEGDGDGARFWWAEAAQLVAAECVILAETKDHQNWELIGEVAKKLKGDEAKALKKLTRKSRTRRTSTCTTPWAGPVSYGSSRSVCQQ